MSAPAPRTRPRPHDSQRSRTTSRPPSGSRASTTAHPSSGRPQAGQGRTSLTCRFGALGLPSGWMILVTTGRYAHAVQLSEIMTPSVVTADLDADTLSVAQLMRDRSVGSVVVCGPGGDPVAMVTDRDLAVRVLADQPLAGEPVRDHASRPLVGGAPGMHLEEAAALMVQHRIRRLPVIDGDELVGIVTLDDIAVRTGDPQVAQRMTQEVIEGALPGFFFHERG